MSNQLHFNQLHGRCVIIFNFNITKKYILFGFSFLLEVSVSDPGPVHFYNAIVLLSVMNPAT